MKTKMIYFYLQIFYQGYFYLLFQSSLVLVITKNTTKIQKFAKKNVFCGKKGHSQSPTQELVLVSVTGNTFFYYLI